MTSIGIPHKMMTGPLPYAAAAARPASDRPMATVGAELAIPMMVS
jgi:hypothetical protein